MIPCWFSASRDSLPVCPNSLGSSRRDHYSGPHSQAIWPELSELRPIPARVGITDRNATTPRGSTRQLVEYFHHTNGATVLIGALLLLVGVPALNTGSHRAGPRDLWPCYEKQNGFLSLVAGSRLNPTLALRVSVLLARAKRHGYLIRPSLTRLELVVRKVTSTTASDQISVTR